MEPHQECAYDHIVVYDGHTTESRHRELDQMELRRKAEISNQFVASELVMAAGLSRPGNSREGPGTEQDRTGPRDLEGPVVLWSRD